MGSTPVGAADAVVCSHHELGGEGAVDLGKAVIKACESESTFKFLYDVDLPIKVIVRPQTRRLPVRQKNMHICQNTSARCI